MKSRLAVASMIAAAGVAGAILAAPIASAEPQNCQNTGGSAATGSTTVCSSPGNAQITTSPGYLGSEGWGMWPWAGGMWAL